MKVTLLQTNIRWMLPEENIREAQRLIAESDESDLYVLPEMWSTGFVTEPQGIACGESGNAAFEWMRTMATSRHCAISGSLAILLDDGSYRNRHYFVDGRNGQIAYYDKHHLFSYGHEDRYYTPGQQQVIVNYAGFRIQLLTCYDLRFPVWSRYATGHEYDAILCVANWPENRQSAWQLLTRARAIENQCYFIGCNRVGSDPYSHYVGCSCVIDAYGKTLGQCHRHQEESLTVDIDLKELQRRRSKFRVLEDRDDADGLFSLNSF